MKKVLHVIDSLHLGGAQEVVLNLATCGNRKRFSHEVATMHGRGVYWERMAEQGIPLHSLSPHKFFPWYAVTLPALLLRGRFDILHCHLVASNIIAKPFGRLCGVPVILNHDHTNDDYRANQRIRLALDSLSNRLASHLIAVSDSCRRFLVDRERVPAGKISLIQNAIDLRRFSTTCGTRSAARKILGLPEAAPVVAGVGRLNPQKNFSLFIQIAAGVLKHHPKTVFLLAGDGPEEERLKKLAHECGVGERLHFCGYVPDTRQIYLAADVLLMPSLFEGLPMSLLEAMAMRVPVVASALDGIAEVVEDGRDGFLVPSGGAELFCERVCKLIADPSLAAELGATASEKIRRRFSSGRMCREVEEIYDRYLNLGEE
ncbi:MAG: glycosyltransferase [Terrimicrobiaceae bacterium]|jgi:glycosyltransferase involved in cell wall biosynthesis|nr:glycosyltransferase [Terrimicrobiaceae bacterium]